MSFHFFYDIRYQLAPYPSERFKIYPPVFRAFCQNVKSRVSKITEIITNLNPYFDGIKKLPFNAM